MEGAKLKAKDDGTGTVTNTNAVVAYQEVKVLPGVTYTLSIKAFLDAEYPKKNHPRVYVYEYDGEGNQLGEVKEIIKMNGNRGAWTEYSGTHTTNAEAETVRIQISQLHNKDAYYDDVTWAEVTQ